MSLPVSNLVNVTLNLSPQAAAGRNFGVLMIAGDSNVINGLQRFRTYTTISEVVSDFGTSAPEYLAAVLYFEQSPSPSTLMIGRWLRTATSGFNLGGTLSAAQQAIGNFTSVTSGGIDLTIDGTTVNLSGLNFSSQSTLSGVAGVITTALSTHGSCVWNGSNFEIISATTGTSSSVAAATTGAGTDISVLLQLTSGLLTQIVPGYAAENALTCATTLTNLSTAFYGLTFAASTMPSTSDYLAIANLIEAMSVTRMFGVSTIDPQSLNSSSTTDVGYELQALGLKQTFTQYSSTNPYSACSMFGRAFSVDFTQQNSTIVLMYKQEPGIVAETLTSQQALVLQNKNINVFVYYNNSTAIIQYGVMAGGVYLDEVQGLDWFQNDIQTNVYNLLYTSTTKIPQTDGGVTQIINAINSACNDAVNNGLLAPGIWTGPSFGSLSTGQNLKLGYYVYAQPIALQSSGNRAARLAPPIQVAAKLAGGIQIVNITVNVSM